ncbi:polysaccharide biosynthesis/export family protein [Ruegeria sp. AU67]|uniref:polysaccharide biosynthesis/export family protein n=1 Tax=Ruegeria sp. AU67 TaxID=2108530 RepID=UPI000D698C7D|nr:polysaccharide biosynthesis/export family protein [Ruegeria sp. AU67]
MLRTLIGLLGLILSASVVQAQGGYRISPGDTLQVEVLEDPSLNRTVLVLPDGSLSFPFVGTVQAGGRSVSSVRDALTSGLAPQFAARPNVYVAVAATALPEFPGPEIAPVTDDIYVMGEVNAPGLIAARPGTTLLQALAQSGGLTPFAAGKRIELRRRNQVLYYDYFRTGKKPSVGGSTVLIPGDVVVVPQRRLFE